MNAIHAHALRSFRNDLLWLLSLRQGVQVATAWLFIWGVIVIAFRILGTQNSYWLWFGLTGVFPIVAYAFWRSQKQLPAFSKIRASYDHMNVCGGLIMAEEAGNMEAWQENLPGAGAPKLRWNSGRPIFLFSLSALFAATTILLPARLTQLPSHQSLQIGQLVQQLQVEVKTLAQEKILEDKKAEDLQKQLSQLQNDSSGADPDKTWEALDHIRESNSDAAKQAAEEAIAKTTDLAQAETLAQAMAQADDAGVSQANANEAAQDLAHMLATAQFDDGLLKGPIPPELLSGLTGLDKDQLQKLLSALESDKNLFGTTVSNLTQLRLIDAATLARCLNAGKCTNGCAALAAYLCNCTNNCNALAACLGKGGPGGGVPRRQ